MRLSMKGRCVVIAISIVALWSVLRVNAASPEYKQVKMYFIRWDTLTRTRLSPSDVRQKHQVYIEVNDRALVAQIVNVLNERPFKNRGTKEPEEARLVIDLVRETGEIDSFYANQSHLITSDSERYQEYGTRFADVFDFLRVR